MKVTLMGPDDLGYWFLDDREARSFKLVQRWSDLPGAAALFGWKPPDGMDDEDEQAENARLWLLDHVGDEIEAPPDVAEYLQQLIEAEQEDE